MLCATTRFLLVSCCHVRLCAGVGGLLDWLFEDSLEGYVICTVFGLGVVFVVRALNLPIVEGKGLL